MKRLINNLLIIWMFIAYGIPIEWDGDYDYEGDDE